MQKDIYLYDYSELVGKIKAIYKRQSDFAAELEISNVSLSDKLNNKSQWSQGQIKKTCCLLSIDESEIARYFFKLKVKAT